MKKRTKSAVIIAAVLIVIGLGLVIAGVIAIGGKTAVKKYGMIQNLVQETVMETMIEEMENTGK